MAGWKFWAWAEPMAVPPDKAAAVMVQTVKDKALSKLFIVSHPLPGFLGSPNIASYFKRLQGEHGPVVSEIAIPRHRYHSRNVTFVL